LCWRAPWTARNDTQVGCFAITTDARALWKANNPATYEILRNGGWIDDVPDPPGIPPWPERAAELGPAVAREVDECAQMRFYREKVVDFWRDHPGEKAKLAVQAVGMLWRPTITTETAETAGGGTATFGRRVAEPLYMVPLYLLALWGAFLAPRRFVALAALLLGYNTLAAMVFAGTVRYRTPWDFLLCLLAAFALIRLVALARGRGYLRLARSSTAR
jgi:hypothetical protein